MEYYSNEYTPADGYARRSISKQDQKIITALDEASPGGLTRQEISARTQISVRSVSARTNALLHDGLIVPKILPDTLGTQIEHRKNLSGRSAQVLILNMAKSAEVK